MKLHTSLVHTPAEQHAVLRVAGNFTIEQIVGEFRALRASVLRMRAESLPTVTQADVQEMTRFNEAIDQTLSESVGRFAALAEETVRRESANKDRFLAILSHELRNPLNAITRFRQCSMLEEATAKFYWKSSSARCGISSACSMTCSTCRGLR
jgi:signal transduction histidine kinase